MIEILDDDSLISVYIDCLKHGISHYEDKNIRNRDGTVFLFVQPSMQCIELFGDKSYRVIRLEFLANNVEWRQAIIGDDRMFYLKTTHATKIIELYRKELERKGLHVFKAWEYSYDE